MNNTEFNEILSNSFKEFLNSGSRSNRKLKILHGAVANDLAARLGGGFSCIALGIHDGKEEKIHGRYLVKTADITVQRHDGSTIAGIGVKFVMQNYTQNSNNYFENMLGETANIRCGNVEYFQIFIVPEKLPHYDAAGNIRGWESISAHYMEKYQRLSEDDPNEFLHTLRKTLLCVIELPVLKIEPKTRREYFAAYANLRDLKIRMSPGNFGKFSGAVVFNDYEKFMQKITHAVLAI